VTQCDHVVNCILRSCCNHPPNQEAKFLLILHRKNAQWPINLYAHHPIRPPPPPAPGDSPAPLRRLPPSWARRVHGDTSEPRSGLLCRRPRRRPADRGHPGRPPRRSHLAQLENLWGFGGLRRLRWSWVLPIGRYLSEIWGDSIMKSKAKQRFQLAKVSIGRIDTEGWDCFTNSVGESSPTQWRLGCGQ